MSEPRRCSALNRLAGSSYRFPAVSACIVSGLRCMAASRHWLIGMSEIQTLQFTFTSAYFLRGASKLLPGSWRPSHFHYRFQESARRIPSFVHEGFVFVEGFVT